MRFDHSLLMIMMRRIMMRLISIMVDHRDEDEGKSVEEFNVTFLLIKMTFPLIMNRMREKNILK